MGSITINMENAYLKECDCGCDKIPEFVRLNDFYSDIWLQCPYCGKHTDNTGGFYYAMEISLINAKRKAVELWNNGETSYD